MRKSLIRLTLAAALVLPLATAPGVAGAQKAKPTATKTKAKAKTKKKAKVKSVDFQKGSDVGGTVATGDGIDLRAAKTVVHSSLIRVRSSFIDQIVRTADRI